MKRINNGVSIGLIGAGKIYQVALTYLEAEYQVLELTTNKLENQAPQCTFIVYCDDNWDFQTQHLINQVCVQQAIPWLCAYTEFGVGILGPCVLPGMTGCLACVEARRQAALNNDNNFNRLRMAMGEKKRAVSQPWLTSGSLEILAQFILQEISSFVQHTTLRTHNALMYLQLDVLSTTIHRFLPEPECNVCGCLPPDTAEAATITLQPRQKLGPFEYRIRSLQENTDALFKTYVDTQTGMIYQMINTPGHSAASTTVWIGISTPKGPREITSFGRTMNFAQSQLAAIAEALERYGGQRPKGKRTSIQASYRQLGNQALDPTRLGLHLPEQYAQPGFFFTPYDPEHIYKWVWGYSFQQQRSLLVPESSAYYGLFYAARDKSEDTFAYDCSNGCALGNCLEEAILHGVLEVAERDAFLVTWYAQLAVPRVDPHSATDPKLRLLHEHLEQSSSYTIYAFNTTLDHGMPCFWVMAVDEQERDTMPRALCTAGSSPHPEQALMNALLELDSFLKHNAVAYSAHRDQLMDMLTNPFAVKAMEDHSHLYLLPEAFDRLGFLSRTQSPLSFHEAFGDFYNRPLNMDLREDLTSLLNHYLALGIDIIVVDQTTTEQAIQDLHCVKVIMPGLLPMTFGHMNRRVNGFERLYQLPFTLGYSARPLTEADINPHPHPFP